MDIKEDILQFAWKYSLFAKDNLTTVSEKSVTIINPGLINTNAGPDFFNAKIKIGGTVWAGNVEIHYKSSDWEKHGHHKDKSYDNTILHVVYKNDKQVFRKNGEALATLILQVSPELLKKYRDLHSADFDIKCSKKLKKIEPLILNSWFDTLLVERIEKKTDSVQKLLNQNTGNNEQAFYSLVARAFGFKINSDPFEMLSKSLPLSILGKHKDDLFQIEALLFGQAGFLEKDTDDEYHSKLKKEYKFLQTKYGLIPIKQHLWKFLRIRPQNFPTVRIAQFANLIFNSSHLFSRTMEAKNIQELKKMFDCTSSEYWHTHFNFGKESNEKTKSLGTKAVETIIINTVIPFLYIYGKRQGDSEIIERAETFLENLKPEINSIITKWKDAGIIAKNAFQTQALIQLHNEYCLQKRCTECRIGNKILTAK